MTASKYFRPVPVVGGFAIALLAVVAVSSGSSAAPPAKTSPTQQADSVVFDLQFALAQTETGPVEAIGQVVYCGVDTLAEPFRLDVLVTNPPIPSDPEDPTGSLLPTHDGAGWLDVTLQGAPERQTFRVPFNDSLSFGLTLGGRPNEDQIVQINSIPAGDTDGRGSGFHGVASVLAQAGATDPFLGDGRTDNYCVSIGVNPNPEQVGQVTLPGEYLEGQISVTMPVPDGWVLDGDGSDGGVLAGFPH